LYTYEESSLARSRAVCHDAENILRIPTRALSSAVSLVLALGSTVWASQPAPASSPADPTEANITLVTAGFFERSQLAHHPLDAELAGKFLDRYLDDLDGSRSLFLQSDIAEFASSRATLSQVIHKNGDTSAAHAIFARYLQRLGQRTAYVTHLLRTAKFDFTGHDVYAFDREKAERPRDLQEAEKVWRQQIRTEYLQEKLADKSPEEVVRALLRRKANQLATMKALRGSEVIEIYLNALAHVYDPHTDYLGHEQMETLSIAMNLSLFGIGAALETEDGYCKIHELLPGGPAQRSGQLKPGDRIVAVAQANEESVDVTNMPLARTVELIRGPKGTSVKLTILPAGAADGSLAKTVSLVRDEIKLEDQQAKARILDMPTAQGRTLRLGVIELPSFYADMGGRKGSEPRSATADVAQLLAKLKKEHVRGVVLDLRGNGGGSLEEAISLTGLFIRQGPVVQTRSFEGEIDVGLDKDASVQYDGPLILLTSRFSASASEILVGALQDYGRAVVVGDSSTFGKGTVQSVLPLGMLMDQAGFAPAYDPGAIKVTMSKFYRPNGASTQLRGVASDIVLPSPSDLSDVNESSLKNPLPWDAVPALPHEQLNRVQPYLATLREKSRKRVDLEKAFTYLIEDVTRLKKSLADKSVSLNEAERRQEISQIKSRQEERKQYELAHSTVQPKSYEITLKNAATPGLPPPMVPKKSDQGATAGPSPDNDILLKETTKILADYVDLLSFQLKGTRLAGPRVGP
jgi:carboxyl-terminal processing protease